MNIANNTNGFRLGATLAWIAMLGASTANDTSYTGRLAMLPFAFVLLSLSLAVGVVIGAELIQQLRPRSVFLQHSTWFVGAALGVGCVAIAGAFVTLTFATFVWHNPVLTARDGVIVSSIAVCSSMCSLLLVCTRARAGRCASCGYDTRSLTLASGGSCPECGQSVLPATARGAIRPRRLLPAPSAPQ